MILDGKKTSELIVKQVAKEVSNLPEPLTLAIILVGKNPASQVYVKNKIKACNEAGIGVKDYRLDENATQKEVLQIIHDCNKDVTVWILVQLPLPSHLDQDLIINAIDPKRMLTD